MSAPPGFAASSSTERQRPNLPPAEAPASRRPRSGYLHDLALRREAQATRQQSAYGLVMGWILTLVAGFMFCCVPSRLDLLWGALIVVGLAHLALAVILPQALAWPQRAWTAIARWQGRLVMTILLTVAYFGLI